ncbi:MAG: response regulator [Myxococcus sp.]|nr:response regulator [Myxococcus sp.]
MTTPGLTLSQWTWRAFLKTLLVPLVLVELVLLGVFLASGVVAHQRNLATLEQIARDGVTRQTTSEVARLDAQLEGLRQLTRVLQARTLAAWDTPYTPPPELLASWSDRPDGAYLSTRDIGWGSMFFSGVVPIGPPQRARAAQLAQLVPVLREIGAADADIVQAYVNTAESLNLIYPAIDAQYPEKMDIPSYNFFYEADLAHNPKREVVFTDAYLDPAGAGWIISAIGPVYRDDTLVAVVGIDITLSRMVSDVLAVEVPWGGYGVLVDRQGVVLALPKAAERDFGLRELVDHTYARAVDQDTPKPEEFRLANRPGLRPMDEALRSAPAGVSALTLDTERLLGWSTIAATGWRYVVVLPRAQVLASALALKREAFRVTALLVVGVVLFYLVFLVAVFRRSRSETALLTEPLLRMRQMVRAIAEGQYEHQPPHAAISELDETGRDLAAMGRQLKANLDALGRRDEALREARAAEATAQAAARARSAFLANMSHEIRTPMNGVLGMLELALMNEPEGEQRSTLQTALRSGQALLAVINDILDASKIEADRLSIEAVPFSLDALVTEVVELFRPMARHRGLTLALDRSGDVPPSVRGDPTRLRQVLTNLLSNAIKFTERGAVTLRVQAEGDRVRFAVIDTGMGIAPERREAVFSPFTQADESTTRRFGGTGLGLTISSNLVRLMGGELVVDSEVGVGSTFHFALPLPAVALEPLAAQPGPRRGRALRVLAAEDNPINQQVLRGMIERLGHSLVMVGNGREALELAQSAPFDVAVFDVHMPELDGLELTRAVRRLERGRSRLPVLALTASALPEDIHRCLDAGMDDVLAKPYGLAELDRKLREVTERTGAAELLAHFAGPPPPPGPG